MHVIALVDSTWISAAPGPVAQLLAEPVNWPHWWPELRLTVTELRGDEGLRWRVAPGPRLAGGTLAGAMEVWLEPALDGVVAHYLLWLDPVAGARVRPRLARRIEHRYRVRAKSLFWTLGARLDPDRLGRVAAPDRPVHPDRPVPGRGSLPGCPGRGSPPGCTGTRHAAGR